MQIIKSHIGILTSLKRCCLQRGENIQNYLSQVLNELEYLNKGQEFLLKDLFKGYAGSLILRADRLMLRTLFFHTINTIPIFNVVLIGKTSSKQQK